MSHGKVKQGDRIIGASVPQDLVKKIDGLQDTLGHESRSETLRVILSSYFDCPLIKQVLKPPGDGDTP